MNPQTQSLLHQAQCMRNSWNRSECSCPSLQPWQKRLCLSRICCSCWPSAPRGKISWPLLIEGNYVRTLSHSQSLLLIFYEAERNVKNKQPEPFGKVMQIWWHQFWRTSNSLFAWLPINAREPRDWQQAEITFLTELALKFQDFAIGSRRMPQECATGKEQPGKTGARTTDGSRPA